MAVTDDPHNPSLERVARLYEQWAGALTLYARQWVDAAAAGDVVQEVFVRLIAQQHRGQPKGNPADGALPGSLPGVLPGVDDPAAWLYRCVRNQAISAGRSGSRRKHRERVVGQRTPRFFSTDPASALLEDEAQLALEHLAPDLREVVVMRIWGQLTLEQVGKILGVSTTTVFNRYRSALTDLRGQLDPSESKEQSHDRTRQSR